MIKTTILASLACLGMAFPVDAQVRAIGHDADRVQVSASFGSSRHRTPVRVAPEVHAQGGHYEYVSERVWVPGHYDEVLIPARYGWTIDSCGHRVWGLISPERCERVWHPGCYEVRQRRIWVPARRHVVHHDHQDHRVRGVVNHGTPDRRVRSVFGTSRRRGR